MQNLTYNLPISQNDHLIFSINHKWHMPYCEGYNNPDQILYEIFDI